jgi:hypothetical protein
MSRVLDFFHLGTPHVFQSLETQYLLAYLLCAGLVLLRTCLAVPLQLFSPVILSESPTSHTPEHFNIPLSGQQR